MESKEKSAATTTGSDTPPVNANVDSGRHGVRSREGSGPRGNTAQTSVKEAVAIAAGKKGMGQSEDDDGAKKSPSNMLCYLYWLLVLLILGLISFTVWLSVQLARRHSVAMMTPNGGKEAFTFDDIFNPVFQPRSYDVKWILEPDNHDHDAYIYRSANGTLLVHNVDTNITEQLVDRSIYVKYDESKSSYAVSHDLRYVLFKYDIKSKWRHSFTARYKIYDKTARDGANHLIDFPNDPQLVNRPLQYAIWAPTSSALLFAYGNNIYYQSDPSSAAVQLTFTGDSKYIFNGVADWLYEEEILSSHVAAWWSHDSRYVCYATFNDTRVPMFRFPYYGPRSDLYGTIVEFAYPKAGDTTPDSNTKVSLSVVDTERPTTKHLQISPPQEFKSAEHYVTQVVWSDNRQLAVVWSNRAQNKSTTTICNFAQPTTTTAHCYTNYYRSVTDGWLDPLPPITFLQGGLSYVTILAKEEGDSGTWNHLALISSRENEYGQASFLTSGRHEVKSIVGYDSVNNNIYYLSTGGDPKQRHLFRVNIQSMDSKCLTCNLSADCEYVSASLSHTARYYIIGCLGPAVPTYSLFSSNGQFRMLLENNTDLKNALVNKALPNKQFMEVPIGGGQTGWAAVWTPPDADDDEKGRRYPLLVHTYGGPGSQMVTERFQLGWETYMASSEEVVYASLDGRGTASRGNSFKYLIYRNLAVVEVEDQLLAGLYFKTLEYVEPSKAAIWGWSYGGFVTAHAVGNETDVYPCGISGAALSDRRYYDTAHSERYLGLATPTDNLEGYMRTDVMRKVGHFRNKKFLVVHGTADDNVHFASSSHLVKALTDADIQFRFQLYTDLNHYFLGSNRHLYHLFTDFLKNECFSYFWKHETETWIVDKSAKKEKFRMKQFCV